MIANVDILGVNVLSGSLRDVVALIDSRLREGRAVRVAFLNAQLSNVCSWRQDLKTRLRNFMVLNDGAGLNIARKILYGTAFKENLNGTDFVPAFLDKTVLDLRIFLLGAEPGVVETAAARISARWPRHIVVGYHHGFIAGIDEDALRATILDAKPDLMLVGMGNPRQEEWISENVPQLCPGAMATGALLDFIAGKFPRAPMWMRRKGMEWVYRLWLEPRRMAGRYLIGNFIFIGRLGLAWARTSLSAR